MTWGVGDTYTPLVTLRANALSLGLAPVTPVLEDYGVAALARPIAANVSAGDGEPRTAALFQYTPAGYDGHFVALQNPAAEQDWLAFVGSYLQVGTPTVP